MRDGADAGAHDEGIETKRKHLSTVTCLAMGRGPKEWERRVRKHFDFLLSHGFAFGGVDDTSFWKTAATYLGSRVGIEIADSREMNRIEIELIRLDGGHLAKPQVWVTAEPIRRTLLDTVIEARSHPSLGELSALSSREIDEQLETWARLLKEVAPELLRGDDAPIADAEAVVRGEGYTTASDGKTLISSDGLRQYRPPTYKPARGGYQANFERKFPGQQFRRCQGNGHVDITGMP